MLNVPTVYALEHAAPDSLSIDRVDTLGLAVFDPSDFGYHGNNQASLSGALQWIELARDDDKFANFLDGVAAVLERPEPPASSRDCQYCRYHRAA